MIKSKIAEVKGRVEE